MTEWYYVDNLHQRQGPVPQDALVKLHRSGALNDASLAWREGMGQWTPLRCSFTSASCGTGPWRWCRLST